MSLLPDYEPCVYFIAAGDIAVDGTPVKVGFTEGEPLLRMEALQTAHYERLTLAGRISGSRSDEFTIQSRLEDHRIRGEWFASSDELRSLILNSDNGV